MATVQVASQSFRFEARTDTVSSFVDARGLAWSVNFPSAESSELFSVHVALAKFRTNRKWIGQLLNPGGKETGTLLTSDDQAGFEIRCWIADPDLKNFSGPVKTGNSSRRIKIGSSDWTKCLEGSKTDGSMFVVGPTDDLGSDFQDLPRNTVVGMKLKSVKKVAVAVEPMQKSENETTEVKAASKIEEGSDADKRMATKERIGKLVSKVGQPVLVQVTKPEQTSLEKKLEEPQLVPPEEQKQQQQLQQQQQQQQNAFTRTESTQSPSRPSPPTRKAIPATPDSDNLVRMIFSEQRLQSADMRMSIKRLEDKLDDVINKLISNEEKDKPVQTGSDQESNQSTDQSAGLDSSNGSMMSDLKDKISNLESLLLSTKQENLALTEKLIKTEKELKQKNEILDSVVSKNSELENFSEYLSREKRSLENEITFSREEISRLKTENETEGRDSNEAVKKTVRKVVSKVFKVVKAEVGGGGGEGVVGLQQLAEHFRNVTEQLLNEDKQN